MCCVTLCAYNLSHGAESDPGTRGAGEDQALLSQRHPAES